jgi:hypothetical protein
MSFAACTGCGRHVRTSDSSCPFCQTAVVTTAGRGGRAVREIVGARASRAALFAGAVLVAGCSSGDDTDPTTGDDGGGSASADGGDASVVGQPVYGAPVSSDGGIDVDDGGTPIAQPVYGSPIHNDGGN